MTSYVTHLSKGRSDFLHDPQNVVHFSTIFPQYPQRCSVDAAGRREGGREGGERERGREGGREGWREGGREGGKEGGREKGREGKKEKEKEKLHSECVFQYMCNRMIFEPT